MESTKLSYYSLFLAVIVDRYRRPQTALTIGLRAYINIAIIMDLYGGPQTALTITLHISLYLAIIMDRCGGPKLPLL
jgi:hypothetical protein